MNLSQAQQTKGEPKQKAPQSSAQTLSVEELVGLSDTADAWFKKGVGKSLDNVDVVRLDYREAQFNGQKCLTDDGKQIYEIMLTMLTKNDAKRFYSFRLFSNCYKAIAKALNPDNEDGINIIDILGKNITLKITDQKGNAYIHECVINADANHEVDGVYGVSGEKFEGGE